MEIIQIRGIKLLQPKDLQQSSSGRTSRRTYWHVKLSGPAVHFYSVLMPLCLCTERPQSQWNNENTPPSDKMVQTYWRGKLFLWRLHNTRLPQRSIYSSRRRASPRRQKQQQSRREKTFGAPKVHTHNLKWMPMFALHRAAIRHQMLRLTLGLCARQPRTLQQADELC